MIIKTKSKHYDVVWQIDFAKHYMVTSDGIVINSLTGNVVSRTVKGYSIGYHIAGKFYTLNTLRNCLEKIHHIEMPF